MLRFILLFILGWLLYKLTKPMILGLFGQSNRTGFRKTGDKPKQSFQEKHKDKIEDADYEDVSDD